MTLHLGVVVFFHGPGPDANDRTAQVGRGHHPLLDVTPSWDLADLVALDVSSAESSGPNQDNFPMSKVWNPTGPGCVDSIDRRRGHFRGVSHQEDVGFPGVGQGF